MTEFPETRESLLVQLRSPDDQSAWDQFVAIYRPVVYRMARRRGLQDSDAQDLSQSVMISVSRSIDSWVKKDQSVRFRHWLRRVARNAIINAIQRGPVAKASGRSTVQNVLLQQPANSLSDEIDFEYRREVFSRAAACVRQQVNESTWMCFSLTAIDNLPVEDVAAKLNRSVGSVYTARCRVMKRLQEAVQSIQQESEEVENGR